ncbi:periplasmic protein [Lacunisphaera limnophila]|uniref:Periplasmic protein n=1 Tax=Lacunisphaera limnophila TaxID=1838286 RepID=A0A1D8AV06_9BACT|nr:BON domain-containing protein [Lacunisphaera limnophila]AOS44734.1 periplasmic protein [Lacunisphaera limnophila]
MLPTLLLRLGLLLALPVVMAGSLVNDRQIETAARRSFVLGTVLEGRVKVSADFGVLTLTGTVEDAADQAVAADTVSRIAGVSGVENKLTILATHREQSDRWIARIIHRHLLVTKGLSAVPPTITVQDAMVTLSGTVATTELKALAGRVAGEISSVKYVRNSLTVADVPATGDSGADPVDDASVSGLVQAMLRRHEPSLGLGSVITTVAGVVRITGPAVTVAEKALITRLAREVSGTRVVNNELKANN